MKQRVAGELPPVLDQFEIELLRINFFDLVHEIENHKPHSTWNVIMPSGILHLTFHLDKIECG